MSDKARYLLERMVNWWDDEEESIRQFVEDIRAYLAEEENKSDPNSVKLQGSCRGDKG